MAGASSRMLEIVLAICIVGIIIFIAVTSLLNRKNQKKEKEKRKKEVREKIKTFIKERESKKNLNIEFEKVLSKKGKEYKSRDVFEVVINMYDAKSRTHIEDRAYEIEGISIPLDKKNYTHEWVINARLDLQTTRRRIGILEGDIKLTKKEKKEQYKIMKIKQKEQFQKNKIELKNEKKRIKLEGVEPKKLELVDKFVPSREKKK